MKLKSRKNRLRINGREEITTNNVRAFLDVLGWTIGDGEFEGCDEGVQFREEWHYRTMRLVLDKRYCDAKPQLILFITDCHELDIAYKEELNLAMRYYPDVPLVYNEVCKWSKELTSHLSTVVSDIDDQPSY